MAAASTAGGGVVYIKPGVYAENLNLLPNVVLVGGFSNNDVGIIKNQQSVIAGSHTFASTCDYIAFKDILFTCSGSGTNPMFTLLPTSIPLSVDIRNCIFDTALNSGNPSSIFDCNGSSQAVNVYCTDSQLNSASFLSGPCMLLGNGSTLTITRCSLITQNTSSCLELTSTTSLVFSSYNTYECNQAACVFFNGGPTTGGELISTFDTFNSNNISGLFMTSSASGIGTLVMTANSITGNASTVNPFISYSSNLMGNVVLNGNLTFNSSGNRIFYNNVASGTAAGSDSVGTVSLVGGTATVNTTVVSANSLFRLTCQSLGTVTDPSALCVTTKIIGTSFTIKASQATDTSTILWEIIN